MYQYILYGVIAVVALLVVIAGLLAALLVATRRGNEPTDSDVQAIIDRLDGVVQQYAEVNAVLLLTKKFEDNAGLRERLAQHSRNVVAATLAYRVDAISRSVKTAQDRLTEYRARVSQGRPYEVEVAKQERFVLALQSELCQVQQMAENFQAPDA